MTMGGPSALACTVGATMLFIGPAAAVDAIKEPKALAQMAEIINGSGYYCHKALIAFLWDTDEYGVAIRVVCSGTTTEGTRYRISINPTTKNTVVRVGW